MKRVAAILLTILVIHPSIACMYVPEVELSVDSLDEIKAAFDGNYSEIDSSTPIRRLHAYGLRIASGVNIEFKPHRSRDGAEFYYSLSCNRAENSEWNCGELYENRSIRIDGPDDTIDIDESLDADTGRRIVETVRDAIILDESERYRYFLGSQEKKSDLPLDLLAIRKIEKGRYLVTAWSDPCTGHEIEVKEIACDRQNCSYEVVRNEFKYYV